MKIKDKKPVTKKEISIKFKCSACGNDTPCFFIIAAWGELPKAKALGLQQ